MKNKPNEKAKYLRKKYGNRAKEVAEDIMMAIPVSIRSTVYAPTMEYWRDVINLLK